MLEKSCLSKLIRRLKNPRAFTPGSVNYLPFEHSENLEQQQKSVELFRQLSGDTDSDSVIEYAMQHLEIIQRFGRFPHRNQILGRETTPEEAEFLKQPGSGF